MRNAIIGLGLSPGKPTAAGIRRALDRPDGPFHGRVPVERTIREILRRARAKAPADGDPWSLATADPDDAALVLPVLNELLAVTDWKERTISVAEARWIATLRRVIDDLDPLEALSYARQYVAREAAGEPSDDLDRSLAWGAWRDLSAAITAYYGEGHMHKAKPQEDDTDA